MDVVIITCRKDLPLLRHFVASYTLYYESKDSLIIFANHADKALLKAMSLPAKTKLIFKEEIDGLVEDDFKNQLYLKLIAHRYVETEHFWMVDSDFLLIAPCSDVDLLPQGKPAWFYCSWNQEGSRWKTGSEQFIGQGMDWQFMEIPQYIFSRKIAAEFENRYDLKSILTLDGASEYMVYGWFAYHHFRDDYHWINLDALQPVLQAVNQYAPTYYVLDPGVTYREFRSAKGVVFWSHWELAERKMVEFFEESQKQNFGKIKMKTSQMDILRWKRFKRWTRGFVKSVA